MEILKKILNIGLVILCIISVLMTGVYLVYFYAIKPNHTKLGINYIGEQSPTDLIVKLDDLTEEQIQEYENRVLFNVNLYSNDNKNGTPLTEFRLDYFTDTSMTLNTCRSSGLQTLCDLSLIYKLETEAINNGWSQLYQDYFDELRDSDTSLYRYTNHDGITWSGFDYDAYGSNTVLDQDDTFIIKIDNTPYLIKLDGYRTIEKTDYFLWWQTGSHEEQVKLTWNDLFCELAYAVATNSKGFGDYYIIFDCSDYFKDIREWNPETNQFDKQPKVDILKNYTLVKFHYDENGASSSSQSLFGSIACNSNYGSNIDTTYWQSKLIYNLSEDDLVYRYSANDNGYYVGISQEIKNMFAEMPNYDLHLTINLQSSYLTNKKINLLGVDYNGFDKFKISTFTIKGFGDFVIQDNAFRDTSIEKLNVSSSINLNISPTAFNNEYQRWYV